MSHLGLNTLSAIQVMSAIWDVRYWEVSLYFTWWNYGRKNHCHLSRSFKCYRAIKSSVTQNSKFNLPHATTQDKKNHQYVSSDKATGPNGIPVKFIKLSTGVIDRHLANIINKDIDLNCYSENGKIVNVRLIFKKDEKTQVKNYQPVSLLNMFSKFYERFIHGNLTLL